MTQSKLIRTSLLIAAAVPLALLAGCGDSQDPAKAAAAQHAAVSRPDPRLPQGFTIFLGDSGAKEFTIMSPPTGGKIATFSVEGKPADVIAFYEREAQAAGMTYAGRMNGGEILSYEARHDGGTPRTFSVTAHDKGANTNVTLSFDVTA